MYTGTCKDRKKFYFLGGEKKTIKRIVAHVQKHHSDDDAKPLGKMPLYPLFSSVKRPTNTSSGKSQKRSKTEDTMVSYDIPKEILKIKKLVKENAMSKNYTKVICDNISCLDIDVKTIENGEEKGKATLKATIPCPLCKKKQLGFIDANGYWSLGNMNRHLKSHNDKGEFKNMDALKRSFDNTADATLLGWVDREIEDDPDN